MSAIPLVPEPTEALPRLRSNEGLLSWIATVDHKQIGILYLITTVFFLLVGGLEAEVLRIQLAQPRSTFLSPDTYNQIFTMHGTTMIFLVVMPLLIGFGNYLVPLMIGARDVAFPRLNALSYWLLLFSGILLYYSFVSGGAPEAGWFAYAPLSEKPWLTTSGMDYYAVGLLLSGIGSIAAAINLVVTILTLRAPGMTLRRLPLFVWMVLFNSVLIILALPSLNAALVMLLFDRQLYAHFFDPLQGGAPVLWQHVFWSFGHPEVYIMVLPAFGMISEIIPVFSRKPIYGYGFIAGSTIAIVVLSLLVYGHHMFASGIGITLELGFGLASLLIAIPTGIKIFNWLATIWGGSVRFTTAMCYAVAFLFLFTIGGVTGVQFAIVPVDKQLEDTYYVVAHMHYVLFGGTFFAVLGAFYYWFPKITGRLLSERLGKINFWLTFIGFNMTFFIQHILGWLGMVRRIYTYPDNPGWGLMNLISTIGAIILGIAVLVFVWNVLVSLRRGEIAGDNPWNAWTLEWATTSPPPIYNFDQIPPVRSRRPLWDLEHPENPDWKNPVGKGGEDQ